MDKIPIVSPPVDEDSTFRRQVQRVLSKAAIALPPLVGYFLVYSYHAAYCDYFGIPSDLVQIDFTTALATVSLLFAFGYYLAELAEAFLDLTKEPDHESGFRRVSRLYFPAFVALSVLLMLGVTFQNWTPLKWGSLLFAITVLFDVLSARVNDRKDLPLASRLRGPFSLKRSPLFGRHMLALAIFIVVTTGLVASIGSSIAKARESFLVPATQPDSVVVRFQGNQALCAGIDRATRKLTGRIFVLEVSREKAGEFRPEKLGRLLAAD